MNAVSPEGFDRIIRLADKNNVVVVPFDNVLDTDKVMEVNEDQKEMGRLSAKFLLKEMGKTSGDILEVRGLPGNSVDRDRHVGFDEVMNAPPNKFNITQVVGNWDTGTSQKVTADALAVHGHFDGIFSQGGDDGTVQALMDAKHPFVPFAGEGENEFRKQIADAFEGRPEGPFLRPVARAGRDLDEGRDLGAAGQPDAAADLGADPGGRLHDPEAGRELSGRT